MPSHMCWPALSDAWPMCLNAQPPPQLSLPAIPLGVLSLLAIKGLQLHCMAGQELRIPPIAWRANPLDWLPEWGGKCHFCPKKLLCQGVTWSLGSGYLKIRPRWRGRECLVGGLRGRSEVWTLMVNKERPEQALGSRAFMYFCQVQMSYLVEAGSCGNLLTFPLVELVFLLSSWLQFWLCYLHMGTLQETFFFLRESYQQILKSGIWLYIIFACVSVCINALCILFSITELTTRTPPSWNTLLSFGKQSNDPVLI